MGCDIHDYVEVRKNGSWEKVGKVFQPYHRLTPPPPGTPAFEPYTSQSHLSEHPFDGRNYNLFAILANVRNDDFVPIAEPRGIPSDASAEYKVICKDRDYGHTHSHVSLRELEEYDWNQKRIIEGWVNADEFKVFKDEGRPSSWRGMVFGPNVIRVSVADMEERITSSMADPSQPEVGGKQYTQVEWEQTYRDSVGDFFFKKTLPEMRALGGPDDVRMVFFFDN